MGEHLVTLADGLQSLPVEGELQNVSGWRGAGPQAVAQELDAIAQEGCLRVLDRGRGGQRHGVEGQPHLAKPAVGGFVGVIVQPAFDEVIGVALSLRPENAPHPAVLRHQALQVGFSDLLVNGALARQGVARQSAAVIVVKGLYLPRGIEQDGIAGPAGDLDVAGQAAIIVPRLARVGVVGDQGRGGGGGEAQRTNGR